MTPKVFSSIASRSRGTGGHSTPRNLVPVANCFKAYINSEERKGTVQHKKLSLVQRPPNAPDIPARLVTANTRPPRGELVQIQIGSPQPSTSISLHATRASSKPEYNLPRTP
ncbi:hypothetical protein AAFF_G00385430 [Aldrovandia affinis]|uniref:Uncharacterized protein n=1 Tax=Aldrovandia affinis TaxID=143900 RepID=A0AAD7SEV7_9TELE|nr:hypothetical protein AAFF_G00385430 [Aldrovandia affinis]